MTPPHGRSLPPTSPFAGDDGACDPRLAAALAEPDPRARVRAVVGALPGVRLLVPVVARLEERAEHGVATAAGEVVGEKSASAALVAVAGPDGRAVLPVFSGIDALRAWDPDARPIPVEAERAALAAVAEGDGLLVLDPGGPVTVPLPRPATWSLAQGRPWVSAPEDPEVGAAVGAALIGLEDVVHVRCEPGRRAELAVVVAIRPGLDRAGLDAVLAAARQALGASAIVAERVDSLELRAVSAAGGAEAPRRG